MSSEGRKGQPGDPQPTANKSKEQCRRKDAKQQELVDLMLCCRTNSEVGLPFHGLECLMCGTSGKSFWIRCEGRLRPSLNQHECRNDQPNGSEGSPRAKKPPRPQH